MKGEYYKTDESVNEYIKLAKGVNGLSLIEELKKHLPRKADVLELGSGPGSDREILNKHYHVTGSDNSDNFLSHLAKKHPQGRFLHIDAAAINIDKRFDGIYSNKVLHHLSNEELEQSIHRQSQILSSAGIVCHSFRKGEGSEVFKGLFVNYHSEEAIEKVFSEKFETVQIMSYKEFENGDSILYIGKRLAQL